MANEVKITDIVGKEAIEQLEKLDKKIQSMRWISPVYALFE